MQFLARYAMQGHRQAVAIATICTAIPLLFWVSAAIIALITLRKGVTEGVTLLLWASLPAITWLVIRSDPTPIITIIGCTSLAIVLRTTASWVHTMLFGVVLGLLVSWLMPLLLPEIVAEVIQTSMQMLDNLAKDTVTPYDERLGVWLNAIFAGVLGSVHLLIMLGCLIIGRKWQSALYNPGGFREEFHEIILPRSTAALMMLLILFGGAIHPALLTWIPIFTVPFLIAGLALVHGIISIKKLSGHWLAGFYMMFFVMGPYIYIFLIIMAFLDSILQFRKRISNHANE